MAILSFIILYLCQLPFLCTFDNKLDFMCPLEYCVVRESRQFSDEHKAVDIQAAVGAPIYAAEAGTVAYSGWECISNPCALRIVIIHQDEYRTGYWHLGELSVAAGQFVTKGQLIGYSGMTGMTSWPHLHFLIMRNGKYLNPSAHVSFALVSPRATNSAKSNGLMHVRIVSRVL